MTRLNRFKDNFNFQPNLNFVWIIFWIEIFCHFDDSKFESKIGPRKKPTQTRQKLCKVFKKFCTIWSNLATLSNKKTESF